MKCIEDKVIPKHIKGDDRERILDVILRNNKTQIQVDSVGKTYVSLCSSTESLIEQVKSACAKLNIVYMQPVCSEQLSFPSDGKISGSAALVKTYKTIYKMTDAEKAKVLDTAMQGWGGSRDGILVFAPVRYITGTIEEY